MPNPECHIVLPPREPYAPQGGGAVARVVYDSTRFSAWREQITVHGPAVSGEVFAAGTLQPVHPRRRWWQRRSRAYAEALLPQLPDRADCLIEVHNRPQLFWQLARRLRQAQLVLYLHNDPQGMAGLRRARQRRRLVQRAAAVITVSEYLRRRLLAGTGLAPATASCHVVPVGYPNSADLQPVTAKEAQAKEPLISFVGRMIPEKGVLELAQALAQVLPQFPQWRAQMIGARHFSTTEPLTTYERQVQSALQPVAAQVDWRGFLPHDAVLAEWRRTAVAAMPSRWAEPFGRVALEAMAQSCALLASDRGGLGDLVRDCAELVDPDDVASIAKGLRRLLKDENRRRERQNAAFATVADYDQARLSAQLDQLRQQLISRDRSNNSAT